MAPGDYFPSTGPKGQILKYNKPTWLLHNSDKHQFLLSPMRVNPQIKGMQGKQNNTEQLFLSFQMSDRIPRENLYRRLRETLDLKFLYRDTKELYGRTGNPSIDPWSFSSC